MPYAHRYKHGKQTELLTHAEFCKKTEAVDLPLEQEAFLWLLYYAGCRKSEAYELTVEQVRILGGDVVVDFGERKKHGARVDPLSFPVDWPGVLVIAAQYEAVKDHRARYKKVWFQAAKNIKAWKEIKRKWLFPHVQSTTAWEIVKRVLGDKYYPHYLRLNRLSEIGSDPESNIIRLKSWSGIKSIGALEAYLGTSRREQEAAREFLNKRFMGKVQR